ncbi:hypothetical protein [Beijerinckia sp. L45]|uniref:hypothetical protein n=1 Tax=Beijerinckia sp. L45 TaxID=1641855 RepID=UPI00131E8B5E|nr:hypothetical protein [Beijerinckia sp. L45]
MSAARPCPQFDCCECGRDIVVLSGDRVPEPALCCSFLFIPGWFRDPDLRKVVDPTHDGVDRCAPQAARL